MRPSYFSLKVLLRLMVYLIVSSATGAWYDCTLIKMVYWTSFTLSVSSLITFSDPYIHLPDAPNVIALFFHPKDSTAMYIKEMCILKWVNFFSATKEDCKTNFNYSYSSKHLRKKVEQTKYLAVIWSDYLSSQNLKRISLFQTSN